MLEHRKFGLGTVTMSGKRRLSSTRICTPAYIVYLYARDLPSLLVLAGFPAAVHTKAASTASDNSVIVFGPTCIVMTVLLRVCYT